MARKKKVKSVDPTIYNEKPESLDGLKKLKEGDLVMYRTLNLFDKCTVASIDKKDGTAKLSNGVKVSRGIRKDGSIIRLGQSTENTILKFWDESCDDEFEVWKSRYLFRDVANSLIRISEQNNMDKDMILKLTKSVNKIKVKYNL